MGNDLNRANLFAVITAYAGTFLTVLIGVAGLLDPWGKLGHKGIGVRVAF